MATEVSDPTEPVDWSATAMVYNSLGRSGLKVSALSLGAWVTYGGTHDDEVAYACMTAALRGGVNFFDNAEGYAQGNAEKTMGRVVKRWEAAGLCRRADLVISTKIFFGDGQGAKGNPDRMATLGFNVYVFRLVAYVISGAMAGYAGALLGNFTTFISPEMMDWSRSGELMFMVILGGASTTVGPVLGAVAFIVLEEVLSHFTIYWHLPFGLLLMAVVLFVRGGLAGMFSRKED